MIDAGGEDVGGCALGDLLGVFMPRLDSIRDGTFEPAWTPALTAVKDVLGFAEPSDYIVIAARPGEGEGVQATPALQLEGAREGEAPGGRRGAPPGDHLANGKRFQHDRQTSSRKLPWYSITFREPAAWCNPSTFCVISDLSRPDRSSSARATCARFGTAEDTSDSMPENIRQTFSGSAEKASIVAYSIGSKRSQSPCDPRKAGMPLSTDMPAPVNATTRGAAPSMRDAASAIRRDRIVPTL